MQITIRQQPRTLSVQIVSVIPNLLEPLNTYLFRCVKCGTSISQVVGTISSVLPGGIVTGVVVINKCPKCSEFYTFNEVKPNKRIGTGITLSSRNNTTNIFHCFVCRTPLIHYREGSYLKRLPEFKDILLPLSIRCSGIDCHMIYKIDDIVTEEVL